MLVAILQALAVAFATYAYGSINVSIVILKLLGFGDPREQGSKNAGATNVGRIAGTPIAGLVLLVDVGRSALCSYLAAWFCLPQWAPCVALCLVLGNCYPLWHGFRGGKGVAALLGFVAAMNPLAAVLSCGAWVAVYAFTKISAVASMTMLSTLAAALLFSSPTSLVAWIGTVSTVMLILVAHSQNWKALRNKLKD